MPLPVGTRVGVYEIVAPLGAGGMGEVYRARDTRLDRIVALKVLPALLAKDADHEARFEREARVIARLSHPNVLALFDVGQENGVRFLIMELVDGGPVSGPMPAKRLVDVATQIADGLAAAHAAGVVHRDLKPANILITRDNHIKLLDFGLARELPALDSQATLTRAVTSPGTVLGTVAYKSPEQARGGAADDRSDHFSLGLVMYELATGRQAFVRDSAAQTLTAIIEADPDLAPLAGLPVPLRWIIERCLAKDPAHRYASTADLARDLLQVRDRLSELSQSGAAGMASTRRRRLRVPAAVITGAAGLAVAALVLGTLGAKSTVSLDNIHFTPFATDAGVQSMPAWSPDGETLAYSGEVNGYYQVFTRALNQSTPSQLTSLEADCISPQWDQTGTRVFFLRVQGKSTDAPVAVGDVWVVSAAGGAPQLVTGGAASFAIAPSGDAIVSAKPVGTSLTTAGDVDLWDHDLDTGKDTRLRRLAVSSGKRIVAIGGPLRFTPDGKALALFTSDDELLLLRNPLTEGSTDQTTVHLTASDGGRISASEFSWFPDGRRFAVALRDQRGGDESIWFGDVARHTVTRVTASAQWETAPAAAPEGDRLAFSTTPLNWDIVDVDLRSGESRPLIASSRYDAWGDWLPDGSGLLFSTSRTGRFEIWTENLHDQSTRAIVTPDAFPDGPSFFIVQGAVSPDQRSVAYVRFSLGQQRIYVSSLAGSRPVRLSAGADGPQEDAPAWSPDGQWITFRRGRELVKALASGGTTPIVVSREVPMVDSQRARWLPDGHIIYRADDGMKIVSSNGGPVRVVTRAMPVLWDAAPDGKTLYAMLEREHRMIDLVSIDIATGVDHTIRSMGRRPLTPDYFSYVDTLRAMRVSPDGTHLMYAFLNPDADIWIMDGIAPPAPRWWKWW
jgi:serine/threonine protein kinase